MIYNLYSIRDSVSGTYDAPFIMQTDEAAIRSFKCEYDRVLSVAPSSPLAMFVSDYDLYLLGEFNADLGDIIGAPSTLVYSGRSLIQPDVK